MGAFDAALVTGGGSGVGRALAILLAGSGTRVTIVGRRAEALDETRRLASKRGIDGITAVAADVSTMAGREEIATSFATEQFRMDKSAEKVCLVHNAAVTGDLATIDGLDPENFRAAMATNVEGPLFLTQQMLPRMAEGSRVLHLSSGSAHRGTAGMVPYCASKARAEPTQLAMLRSPSATPPRYSPTSPMHGRRRSSPCARACEMS